MRLVPLFVLGTEVGQKHLPWGKGQLTTRV
jgi:hypothetical protein